MKLVREEKDDKKIFEPKTKSNAIYALKHPTRSSPESTNFEKFSSNSIRIILGLHNKIKHYSRRLSGPGTVPGANPQIIKLMHTIS